MPQPNLLQIEQITKKFGATTACDQISLDVKSGEIYALIGPNGSGKTTLIHTVVGLLEPDSGRVLICQKDISKKPQLVKSFFGFVPDNPVNYPYLTGQEFLGLTAKLKGISNTKSVGDIKKLSEIFPITDILSLPMEGYSRGSLQKVAFLASLLGHPKLLVIDEPIVGLDPQSIKIFGNTLRHFTLTGGAVLLSTHTLSFAKEYASKIGIIANGKLKEEIISPKNKDIDSIFEKSTRH